MSATEAAIPAPTPDPVAGTTATTTTAAEAVADPVRPTEAAALTAESRPEVTGETAASAAAIDAPTKESVGDGEAKIEAQPIAEGTLSYKGPGLLKNLLYNKKHFWFGDEALGHESLSNYLKSEKDKAVAHHNAAHAAETGKGLLFFSKRQEDKSAPEGIINLGDALNVTREPGNRFSFKVHDKTYNFHAPTKSECESWVVSVETAIKDAAANKEVVINGEKYKLTKEKLAKPVAAGAVGAAAGAAVGAAATSDKVHDGTPTDASTVTASKEEKPRSDSKGRSASRKRQSIFGSLMGKKDDKAVEQANEKEAKKEEAKEETKPEVEDDKAVEAGTAAVPVAAAAAPAAVVAAEDKKVEEPTAATEEPKAEEAKDAPAKSKRASVFGFFSSKKSGEAIPTTKDTKEEEVAPVVPAKDTPVTTDAAPQLDPVDTTTASEAAPVAAVAATDASVAGPQIGSEEPHKNPLAPLEATPEVKAANKQKEGGDLFSFMKKKKAEHDVKEAEDKAEGAAAAEKTEGTSTSPGVNEKRRSSFFNSLGSKKERGTSPEGDKKASGGLFRKFSKSQKATTGPVTDAGAPPAIPKTDEAVATEEAAKVEPPVTASTDAAVASEAAAKAEVPAVLGTTTGTDDLPVTKTTEPTTTV